MFSIIIPTYNEADQIAVTIAARIPLTAVKIFRCGCMFLLG